MSVYVSPAKSRAAINDPIYIIRVEKDDRIVHYLTWALLEYDPAHAGTTEEVEGCATVAELFDQGVTDGDDAGLSVVLWVPPPGPLPPGVETNDD